ncbi:helix-turn-helix domain-containing protein [Bacillus pacificus]|nr:helix-turn-helix domain-containing protein [Bacillus thuringiensis]MED1303843.1 helix-turn-helix domain-containing protein [Bacillus pacificus]
MSSIDKTLDSRWRIDQVVEMLNNGEAVYHIAKENGVTRQTVYRIKSAISS